MPSDLVLKSANSLHRLLMAATGGRIGWSIGGMPVLELTTTGRQSGEPRTVMLTAPWVDGERMAIVASAGGNDRHPAWFLNLESNPDVTVKTATDSIAMRARIVEGEEYDELWSDITSRYRNYADYQNKTSRQIPIVVLEPVS